MLPGNPEEIGPRKSNLEFRIPELPDQIHNTVFHIELWESQ